MAVQGRTCDRKKIDLKQIIQSIRNEEIKANANGSPSVYKRQDVLTIINGELSKLLTPQQTKFAMEILRGLRSDATQSEKDTALVSFNALKNEGSVNFSKFNFSFYVTFFRLIY